METREGTRMGSGGAEERGKSARNHTRSVEVIWEAGETSVGRAKKCRHERVGSVAAN